LLAAVAVFEFAPGVRELALPRSGGTASASNEDTVSVPAGAPIGGPFLLTDATAAMKHDMTAMMWAWAWFG
jgi:protein SCO1/2